VSTPRPFTRAEALENAAFLAELRRTGNAREAARRIGAHRAKFTRRRTKHPHFATQWDAALAFAQDALAQKGDEANPAAVEGLGLVRRRDGRLQLRRPPAKSIGHAARQRFLLALSATANVRLAARAAGFSHASFYARRRSDPVFAREWRDALAQGYDRLEHALIAGFAPGEPDEWSRNEPPALPPMTAAQALQLLYLHQKEARLWEEPQPIRRRRGESDEARNVRLALIFEARLQHQRDLFDRAEAARQAELEPPAAPEHEPTPIVLPDLTQVTGWSKAAGKPAHDPDRALFGGWRIDDWRDQE
jgi:hypothetical protein